LTRSYKRILTFNVSGERPAEREQATEVNAGLRARHFGQIPDSMLARLATVEMTL
jgi:hypothetical protein